MLKKEDGALDFNRPADELVRRVQGFNPWPGAFTHWQGQPLKIHRASAIEEGHSLSPGAHVVYQGLPAIAAAQGLLILHEVQPAGKKAMPGKTFLQGAKNWI
jgi:methionyl-tRNA formyltransferase